MTSLTMGQFIQHDAAHLSLDLRHQLRRQVPRLQLYLTVQAVVRAELRDDFRAREQFMDGHDQQEFHGTAVDNPASLAVEFDEFEAARPADRRLEIMHRVVELDSHDLGSIFLLIIRHEIARQDIRQDISVFADGDEQDNLLLEKPAKNMQQHARIVAGILA